MRFAGQVDQQRAEVAARRVEERRNVARRVGNLAAERSQRPYSFLRLALGHGIARAESLLRLRHFSILPAESPFQRVKHYRYMKC